jgi:hypothetical protein
MLDQYVIRRRETMWLLPLLLVIVNCGCTGQHAQISDELDAADFIIKVITYYEQRIPNSQFTNLQEVFLRTETPYPERWHYRFRRFGTDAGFRNSFYEKYVVLPHGFQTSFARGEIVLLNAKPFPSRDGTRGRLLLSRTGTRYDDWNIKWVPEGEVQQVFRDAGQTIPKPPVLPAPTDLREHESPPLRLRILDLFRYLTANLGLGTGSGKYLMHGTFGLFAIGAALVVWLTLRRRD